MSTQLDYIAHFVRNREAFLLNYSADFRAFDAIIERITSTYSRLGKVRDKKGNSHAGLILFANILIRHAILGFQHFASYQSFVGWLVFRPGLEALLILGKFVDDPNNATIWRKRHEDRQAYQDTFLGQKVISDSLPRSSGFRKVMGRLNDEFMHPNPDFATNLQSQDGSAEGANKPRPPPNPTRYCWTSPSLVDTFLD